LLVFTLHEHGPRYLAEVQAEPHDDRARVSLAVIRIDEDTDLRRLFERRMGNRAVQVAARTGAPVPLSIVHVLDSLPLPEMKTQVEARIGERFEAGQIRWPDGQSLRVALRLVEP
jgi:hypothetical protein